MRTNKLICQCGAPAVYQRYCLACLDNETKEMSNKEREAAAHFLGRATATLSPCLVDGCGMSSSDLPVHLWAVHGLRAADAPVCGHYDSVARCPHCDLYLCFDETCPAYGTHDMLICGDEDWENPVADDWYILSGITDGSDSFPCRKCGETIHPWYTRCEACGDTSPGTPPKPQLWTCSECGTSDYDSELDAERCCSLWYCHDCGYDRGDLREQCHCPAVCTECEKEVDILLVEEWSDTWRTTAYLSRLDLPPAVWSQHYRVGPYCQPCYEQKGGDWDPGEELGDRQAQAY